MEKHTIEIECPEGFVPRYDKDTNKIEFIKTTDTEDRVQTFEEAAKILKMVPIHSSNPSVNALHKLHIILNVLNKGHKFDLVEGEVWYPYTKIYKMGEAPEEVNIVEHFYYNKDIYLLSGGYAENSGSRTGLGHFSSEFKVGFVSVIAGALACKDKETALYVSRQFGRLIFEACFLRHFNESEFKWL